MPVYTLNLSYHFSAHAWLESVMLFTMPHTLGAYSRKSSASCFHNSLYELRLKATSPYQSSATNYPQQDGAVLVDHIYRGLPLRCGEFKAETISIALRQNSLYAENTFNTPLHCYSEYCITQYCSSYPF